MASSPGHQGVIGQEGGESTARAPDLANISELILHAAAVSAVPQTPFEGLGLRMGLGFDMLRVPDATGTQLCVMAKALWVAPGHHLSVQADGSKS